MTSAEQTKEERIENEQRLAEYKLTRRLSALEKKDAVKKSLMQSQRKLDSFRMQKIQAVSHLGSPGCHFSHRLYTFQCSAMCQIHAGLHQV